VTIGTNRTNQTAIAPFRPLADSPCQLEFARNSGSQSNRKKGFPVSQNKGATVHDGQQPLFILETRGVPTPNAILP
jgi:hypothetical protein